MNSTNIAYENTTDTGYLLPFSYGEDLRQTFGIPEMLPEVARDAYGVWAIASVFVPMVLFMSLYKYTASRPYKFISYAHQFVWWPTVVVYLATFFFDSLMLRRMFEIAVIISQTGPMLFYWYGLAQVLFYVNNLMLWRDTYTWIFIVVFALYLAFVVTFQLLLLPKVFEWIEKAPIQYNST